MPGTIRLRPAAGSDAAALSAIHNAQGVATTASYELRPGTVAQRAEWLARHRREGFPVLVAIDEDDQVVGFAAYDRFRELPGYDLTVEHSVYVAPGHEHEGIGLMLMTELIDQARRAGLHAMVGVVDAGNRASLAFHERLGFTNHGVLPQVGRKFGRWLDVAMLVRLLDDPPTAR
ncbi:Acetyltransferase (GNAT) family [Propionibacterium ruminifibrarum]|uniref:Acetyltransferase (GNAT) family n=1 Tax=Propionibacterium ruminifibrarum TaxID=1962131 RepID=A0A375I5F8_9ACTN|nr:GNAT family N-acetyltransferase [Propionibacterium ruminifibrarum]SPF68622.1 Acetyltransferase (GNAT) family [Propionibacterium ruminifibrarum]